MTLYELIRKVSSIITTDDDSFYSYVIHTSDDDGGFLRTSYCWHKSSHLKDFNVGEDFHKVLVASQCRLNPPDFLEKKEFTHIKLQFTYSEKNASIEDADWDVSLGYCYVYIFDLDEGTYSMVCVENRFGFV